MCNTFIEYASHITYRYIPFVNTSIIIVHSGHLLQNTILYHQLSLASSTGILLKQERFFFQLRAALPSFHAFTGSSFTAAFNRKAKFVLFVS